MSRSQRQLYHHDDKAVTPVIGTVIILLITTIGIGIVLYWGTPAIQQLKDNSAQVAMMGELDGVRHAGLSLTVPDSSKSPGVTLAVGTYSIEPGTRSLITANHDNDVLYRSCNMEISNWWEDDNQITLTFTNCRTPLGTNACGTTAITGAQMCFEIYQSQGDTLTKLETSVASGSNPIIFEITNPDGSDHIMSETSDYLIKFTDNRFQVYVTALQLNMDQIVWRHASSQSDLATYLEGGLLINRLKGQFQLLADPGITETGFTDNSYTLRLTDYNADPYSSYQGQGNLNTFLRLDSNTVPVQSQTAYTINYQFIGELGQSWCNTFANRNTQLDSIGAPGRYGATPLDIDNALTTGVLECDQDLALVKGINTERYQIYYKLSDDYTAPETAFPYEVIHGYLYANIRL